MQQNFNGYVPVPSRELGKGITLCKCEKDIIELISIKAWAEKHSFDQGDTFDYLKGKILDGVLVKSVNTKVSEAALDALKSDVLAAQKRKPLNKGMKKAKVSESSGGKSILTMLKKIDKPKPVLQAIVDITKVVDPAILARIQKSKQEKSAMRTLRIQPRQTRDIIIDLDELKKADKIYIDTCSLMETPFEKFFEKANPILRNYNKKLIVPSVVVNELRKIADSKDPEKQGKAKTAINVLDTIMSEIELSNEEDDNEKIADQVFKIIFERYRNKCKMLLITQDLVLSDEILSINNSQAVHGEKCVVYRINDDGELCESKKNKWQWQIKKLKKVTAVKKNNVNYISISSTIGERNA